jgi:hypothetical protein
MLSPWIIIDVPRAQIWFRVTERRISNWTRLSVDERKLTQLTRLFDYPRLKKSSRVTLDDKSINIYLLGIEEKQQAKQWTRGQHICTKVLWFQQAAKLFLAIARRTLTFAEAQYCHQGLIGCRIRCHGCDATTKWGQLLYILKHWNELINSSSGDGGISNQHIDGCTRG